jgi:adenine-specific DNA-methyltransferase
VATRIRYMGNKHDVAPVVAELVSRQPFHMPFIDAFSGMCSVGGAIAPSGRPVICNDIQGFAALVARCLVATSESSPAPSRLREALSGPYEYNRRRLSEYFREDVAEEDEVLADGDPELYRAAYRRWDHAANDIGVAEELAELAEEPGSAGYCLASLSYAWGYFGLRQAIGIDSIRYAIDRARESEALSEAHCDWALVALLQAASCASASPGHFAQYLRPTADKGLLRILNQRRRNIWSQFMHEASLLKPYGNRDWRRRNRVLQADARTLAERLDEADVRSGVIYADPPYSKDHYSRYYHVLETLTRYDHPTAEGKGRYRPDRFATQFSIKTKVESAMDEFCAAIGERGFTLILSYPSNGLLNEECGVDPAELLGRHFTRVELCMSQPTSHSTLGARHGSARNQVDELLWLAS